MFTKHMRLVRDIQVKEFTGGNKSAFSVAAYDTYAGKEADGSPKYDTTFINVSANSEREVKFLEQFGKKGSLLKFTGDIKAGKPFENRDKVMVSAINLNVKLVEFPEFRVGTSKKDNSQSGTGTQNTPPADTSNQELEKVDEVFEFWNQDEE